MINYLKKSIKIYFWILDKLSKKRYIKSFPKYLKWLGINIDSKNTKGTWISPTIFLDSTRYDYINIGNKVTISFGCSILIHDYSVTHVARAYNKELKSIIIKKVFIGNNVFIGCNVTILPGTIIGDNTIIGAGSVVKGVLESNCIYAGNPCKKIGTIDDFYKRNHALIKENFYDK